MKIPARKIDAASIFRATEDAKYRAESLRRKLVEFEADSRKSERLIAHECKRCFYIDSGRIGGAAMTTAECGICKKETMFSSTCVDIICKGCSGKYDLCVHCGGDIEMKHRKKKRDI